MEAVFPQDFTRTGTGDVPQIPATGNKQNAAVSTRIVTGNHQIRPEISGNGLMLKLKTFLFLLINNVVVFGSIDLK